MAEKVADAPDSAVTSSDTAGAEQSHAAQAAVMLVPSLDRVTAASGAAPGMGDSARAATITSAQATIGTARLNRLMNPPVGPDRRSASLQPSDSEAREAGRLVRRGEEVSAAGVPVPGTTSGTRDLLGAGAAARQIARDDANGSDDGGILGSIRRRIAGIVSGLQAGWGVLARDAGDAASLVHERERAATADLTSIAEGGISRVQGLWATARTAAAGLAGGLTSTFGGAVAGVTRAIGGIKQALLKLDAGGLSTAWGALNGVLGGAWSALQAGGGALRQRLAGLWSGLQGGFAGAMTRLSAAGRSFVDGLRSAASGALERLSSMWQRLTGQASALAGEGEGLAARALRAMIAPIVSVGQRAWGAIQGQWQALRERTAGWLSGVEQRARGAYAAIEQRASSMWGSIRTAWTGIRARASALADRLLSGVGGMWTRIRGLSIGGVVGKLAKYGSAIRKIEAAAANPMGLITPFVDRIAERLGPTPTKAAESLQEKAGSSPAPVAAVRALAPAPAPVRSGPATAPTTSGPALGTGRSGPTPAPTTGGSSPAPAMTPATPTPVLRGTATWPEIWDGITESLKNKWRELDVKKVVKDTLVTLVWPWPTVCSEFAAMWTEWKQAVGSFYAPRNPLSDPAGFLHDLYTNLLRVEDMVIILYRHLVQAAMALMGWVTIFLTILGFLGGGLAGTIIGGIAGALSTLGIATAPGAGAGAAAGGLFGAGVGFGVALALGEALLIGYVAGELAAMLQALLELKTGLQTPEEQTRDYNQVANSGIGLAIVGLLMALAYFAGRLAAMAVARLARFVPDAVRRAAARFAEGVRSVRKQPDTPREIAGDVWDELGRKHGLRPDQVTMLRASGVDPVVVDRVLMAGVDADTVALVASEHGPVGLRTLEALTGEGVDATTITRLLQNAKDLRLSAESIADLSERGVVGRLLRGGMDPDTLALLMSDLGPAGLETIDGLTRAGVGQNVAIDAARIANRIGVADEVARLTSSGNLRNAGGLRNFLRQIEAELRVGNRGKLRQLQFATELSQHGPVALEVDPEAPADGGGPGRGDVMDAGEGKVYSMKVVTSADRAAVPDHVRFAAEQLRGETGEAPPAGFRRIIRIEIEGPRPGRNPNPLLDASRGEILRELRDYGVTRDSLRTVDSVQVVNQRGTFTFTPDEF